jgi:DNA-binding NarL/FixJ family response regulator
VAQLTEEAEDLDDAHSVANARVAGARVALAQGRVSEAIQMTDERGPHAVPPPMRGEYLAVHALALACAGAAEAALAAVELARSSSRALETETSAKAAEAIISLQSGGNREPIVYLLEHIATTQHLDAFVAAYRGHPPLLRECVALPTYRGLLEHIITVANDADFASRLGVRVALGEAAKHSSSPKATLSPREEEVLRLISLGLSNAAIAAELYISEATVKVHVRHILEKLGARSRTDAVMRFADRQPYAAPST